MGIWDTAGSERYEAMSRIYYRGAKAAILCYDLTENASFERVKFWVDELLKNEENCRIYLCGTKVDLVDTEENKKNRKVDYHETTDYGDSIKAKVFETSSKTGHNIKELFTSIAKDYVEDPRNNEEDVSPKSLDLQEDKTRSRGCCS
ncbi:ras-related protein Rab-24-like isoform X2 [Antedon mediterranea]